MKTNTRTKLLVAGTLIGGLATFIALAAVVCNENAIDVGNSVNWTPRNGGNPAEDTPTWQPCQLSGPYTEDGPPQRTYYECVGNASLEVFYSPDEPFPPMTIKRLGPGNPANQQPTGKLFIWDDQRVQVRCQGASAECSGRLYQGTQTLCSVQNVFENNANPITRFLYSGRLTLCGSPN